MKHIKLLGLLATAAALSFTVTSCSNGDAGGDVQFTPKDKVAIPADIKADHIYIYDFPSKITGEGNVTFMLEFGDQYVGSVEGTTHGQYVVESQDAKSSTYEYTVISDTEASIVIYKLYRPTGYDEANNTFKDQDYRIELTLKYSPSDKAYTAWVDGVEYTNVRYVQR